MASLTSAAEIAFQKGKFTDWIEKRQDDTVILKRTDPITGITTIKTISEVRIIK